MKTIQLNQKCSQLAQLGLRTICVMIPDAVLCGTCGLLYGMVFGGLSAKVHHDLSGIYSIVGTCGGAGLVIGAVVAVLREVFRTRDSASAMVEAEPENNDAVSGAVVIPYVRTAAPQNQKIASALKATPRSTAISG